MKPLYESVYAVLGMYDSPEDRQAVLAGIKDKPGEVLAAVEVYVQTRSEGTPPQLRCIDLEEFAERGYLQEANRQFFHPLGLALVLMRPYGALRPVNVAGIRDARSDPEGVVHAPFTPDDLERARGVKREQAQKALARLDKLGFVVQPIEGLEVNS